MATEKKPPVTLAEVFRYAELYGVDITVSYDSIFPGNYILKFSKKGHHHIETTQRFEPDHPDFDGLCRYILEAGCEKLNRNVIENFIERKIRPKFEEGEEQWT